MATYYVATTGNDYSDGTSWDQAFRTLEKASRIARTSGDIIIIRAGTYLPPNPYLIGTNTSTGYVPATGTTWQFEHWDTEIASVIIKGNSTHHGMWSDYGGLPSNPTTVTYKGIWFAERYWCNGVPTAVNCIYQSTTDPTLEGSWTAGSVNAFRANSNAVAENCLFVSPDNGSAAYARGEFSAKNCTFVLAGDGDYETGGIYCLSAKDFVMYDCIFFAEYSDTVVAALGAEYIHGYDSPPGPYINSYTGDYNCFYGLTEGATTPYRWTFGDVYADTRTFAAFQAEVTGEVGAGGEFLIARLGIPKTQGVGDLVLIADDRHIIWNG